MLKLYKYLKRAGAVANAARQIVLAVLLVISIGQDVDIVGPDHTSTGAATIKI